MGCHLQDGARDIDCHLELASCKRQGEDFWRYYIHTAFVRTGTLTPNVLHCQCLAICAAHELVRAKALSALLLLKFCPRRGIYRSLLYAGLSLYCYDQLVNWWSLYADARQASNHNCHMLSVL